MSLHYAVADAPASVGMTKHFGNWKSATGDGI
jgi:hypothetical protein